MRIVNCLAALSGAGGLITLALAHHAFSGVSDANFLYLAAGALLSSGAGGLAIASRGGRIALVAGLLMTGGACLFATVIWLGAMHMHAVHMAAPVGGGAMIAGWIVAAFAPANRG